MAHTRHWVGYLLHCGRDRDKFLDHTSKSINVVVPVKDVAQIKIIQRWVPKEAAQEVCLDVRLSIENSHRHCPVRHRRTMRLRRHDELTRETAVLDYLLSQDLSQSSRRGDCGRLLCAILTQELRHTLVFSNQINELLVM